MKAIKCAKYGTPDVLRLVETEKPTPKDNEILIRIDATVVTPSDCAFRKADPFVTRFFCGLAKPKFTPGVELAGQVEATGRDVTLFKKGDFVYGASALGFGAHAEYKCLPETGVVALKPSNMTSEEAVALCDGALTSLTFLRDIANVRSGQKVLINGASGAVGIYAVQLAKHYGAKVTGVCSAANLELVRFHGADEVIDYTKADFTKTGHLYDIVFDAIGKSSFSRCKGLLKPHGLYLGTVPTPSLLFQTLWTSRFGGKKAVFSATGLKQRKENLIFLKELAEAGKIKPVIDKTYPLEQIAAAHRYVDSGRKRGNVVITVL